jgi:hypothetical protein
MDHLLFREIIPQVNDRFLRTTHTEPITAADGRLALVNIEANLLTYAHSQALPDRFLPLLHSQFLNSFRLPGDPVETARATSSELDNPCLHRSSVFIIT